MDRRSKRIILATIGSLGDLHPCLALALGLQARGHLPIIATTEIYRSKVQSLGLDFHAIRPDIPAHDPQMIRMLMDMRRGPEFLLRKLILPAIRDTYQDLVAASTDADLLVAGEIVFAAPLVAEKLGLLWVSAILSPFSFLSAFDPSVSPLAPSLGPLLRKAGSTVNRAFLRFGWLATYSWWEPVRRLRRELGVRPGVHPLFSDKFSHDLTLALFSPEVAQPQPDWPPKTVQPGFLYYDAGETSCELSSELKRFLDAGPAPVVFTLGSTAVHDPRGFFDTSLQAAKAIGRPAIFLTGANPAPASNGSQFHSEAYAPFSKLFTRASVIVHQGGSGTTAQALRAGKPALIMPCAFDQPDNAARIERIGAALSISRSQYRPATAAGLLTRLTQEPGFTTTARRIAARLSAEDGLTGACDAIERLLNETAPKPKLS